MPEYHSRHQVMTYVGDGRSCALAEETAHTSAKAIGALACAMHSMDAMNLGTSPRAMQGDGRRTKGADCRAPASRCPIQPPAVSSGPRTQVPVDRGRRGLVSVSTLAQARGTSRAGPSVP